MTDEPKPAAPEGEAKTPTDAPDKGDQGEVKNQNKDAQ